MTASLAQKLAAAFADAAAGRPAHPVAAPPLVAKVGIRGGKRMIIVWAVDEWNDGAFPLADDVLALADEADFLEPRLRPWKCAESERAQLVTDAYAGQLCVHDWQDPEFIDTGKDFATQEHCAKCGGKARKFHVGRRSRDARFFYNGQQMERETFDRRVIQGPPPASVMFPDDLDLLARESTAGGALPEEGAEEGAASPPAGLPEPGAASRPAPHSRAPLRFVRTPEAELDYRTAQAIRARRMNIILSIDLYAAVRVPSWYGRDFVIAGRTAYLKRAKLSELQEELEGGFVAANLPTAYVFATVATLALRNRRALPWRNPVDL